MPLLDTIDTNPKDNNIDIQELQDALKPQGFLSKQENVQKVSEELQKTDKDKISETLEKTINIQIEKIQEKSSLNDDEVKIIHLWFSLFGEKPGYNETKEKLKKQIDKITEDIAHKVDRLIGANAKGNINYYNTTDIRTIQLRANTHFGDPILLDGSRGNIINIAQNTANQKQTNLYIYRLELMYREDITKTREELGYNQIFEHLLQTPNLEDLLNTLPKQSQDKVLGEFLDFYLREVKQNGMFFEDKIGGETLAILLVYMINKEKYKQTTLAEYYGGSINTEVQKQGYQYMGDFFEDACTQIKKGIREFNNTAIAQNKSIKTQQIYSSAIENIAAAEKELADLEKNLEGLSLGLGDNTAYFELQRKIDNQILSVIENKLKMYEATGSESILLETYLYIKNKHGDKKIYIAPDGKQTPRVEHILENPEIKKYGVSYQDYQKKINEYQNVTQPNELKKRDEVNDILLQARSDQKLKQERPNFQEFKENCYTEYMELLRTTQGNIQFKDYEVPRNISKLYIPGVEAPLYVKSGLNPENVIKEKIGKKQIVLDINKGKNKNTIFSGGLYDINDITFGYTFEDKEGNTIIEDINGKIIKTITPEDKKNAQKSLYLANLDTYDEDMQGTLKSFESANNALNPLTTALSKYQSGGMFAGKDEGISENEAKETLDKLKNFKNTLWSIEGQVDDWKEQRNKLLLIQKQSDGIKNDFEKGIDNMVATFDSMISFFEVRNGSSQARGLLNNVGNIGPNQTFKQALLDRAKTDGLKTLFAIGLAVAAIVLAAPSGGASIGIWAAVIGSGITGAVIGTAGGMVGLRLGTITNEWLLNTFDDRYKDGGLQFTDKTDIELVLSGKIPVKDFFINLGKEFAMGTITTFAFIKAGGILGNIMAKSTNQNILMLQKIINKVMLNGESAAAKNAINSFGKEFSKEFSQELRQESLESGAEKVNPVLGGLMSILSCLGGPSHVNIENKYGLAGGKSGIDYLSNAITTQLTYDANKTNTTEELQTHYKNMGYDISIDINGKILAQKKLEQAIEHNNQILTNHIIQIQPSTASITTNNMTDVFSEYNMTINHNATDTKGNHINEVIFPIDIDPTKLQEFKTNIEKSGKGVITTNPDGSFTLQTTQETIIFKPNTHKTEITNNQTLENIRTQAHTNYITKKSKLQENIQNETDPKKKEKLEEKMQDLEKAYIQFNAVIDGEITMDQNYVGVRNIAKELGLDIETEQLPLLKLIVIAEIKHQTGKTEVTQADIDAYINQQLPIDQTIQDVFGENLLNPVEFNGGDPISQIDSILESFSVKNSELLSESDIQTLQKFTQGHIQSLIDGMGLTPAQAFDLTQKNIRKLIFQNIADKGLLSGSDHGIVHIVQGDVFNARQTLDQLNISDPKKKAQIKAMLGQIIVDHDIGYNMAIFENMIQIDETTGDHNKNTFFDATKDHPIYSRLFVEANEAYYIQMFGKENVDAMKVAMLDHSDIHSLDFSQADNLSTTQLLQQLIASADCMGVTHVDKLHALFMNQNMMLLLCKFDFINKSFAADDTRGIQLHQQVKSQMLSEIQTMYTNGIIDKTTAQYYTNAIEKGIDTYNKDGENPNAFGLKFNMSSYIYATEGLTLNAEQNGGTINMSIDMGMFESVNNLYGGDLACNNLVKILGDYGKIVGINKNGESFDVGAKEDNFGLHNIITESKLGDIITIQTQQPGGSIVTFDIQITQTPENNIGLKENLDKIALYNKDISANIQIIIKELGDNNFNQTTIDKSLFSILTKDPEIGDQIQEILDSKDTAKTKQQKIQELRGANISQSFDAIITNNQVNDTQTELTTQQEQELIQQSNQELEQETKNIDQQIQQNKNNPEGLKNIIQSLITRSKNAVTELNAVADESIPMYKKTKHFLHAMNEMFVTHHALHEIHAMKDNSTIIYQAVMNKERRTAVGASIDLMTNVVIFTAVTKVHIAHLLHGDLVSGFYLQTSLTTSLDQIKNLSKHAKDILIGQQEQHNNYNEMQNRREQWTPENTDAMINNYLTNIKTLVRGRNREDIPGLQEKIQELYPDIQIQESVHDTLSDILAKIENSQGDTQKTHIENMHTFIEYLNPKQSLESEIRSFVSNMYSGISPRGHIDHTTEAVTNPLGHTFGH